MWITAARILAFGFLNRCRGGLIPLPSVQLGRFLFWALPLAAYALWRGYEVVPCFWALLGAFAGVAIPNWGKYWNLKDDEDWLMMSLCGLCVTICPAFGLAFHNTIHAIIFGISGVLMPVFYWLGARIPLKIQGLTQGPEVSEVLFGMWVGLALGIL